MKSKNIRPWKRLPTVLALGVALAGWGGAVLSAAPFSADRGGIQAKSLAKQFQVNEAAIEDMRVKDKLEWPEIIGLLVLSNKTGEHIDALLALYQQGVKLDQIARRYNQDPNDVNAEVLKAQRQMESETNPGAHNAPEVRTESSADTGSQADTPGPGTRF